MSENWQEAGFGLYIHWPFCQAKCPYCDFNSHVRAQIDHKAWAKALISELRFGARGIENRKLDSIFFGGGTPSLMPAQLVASLLEMAAGIWTFSEDIEITLEANPTSVEAEKFTGFAAAGVNRVSMGIQALNDPDLKRLGRLHSAAEARAAFDIARRQFDRVSFDLIYARQDQTLADWEAELTAACQMAIDHLSAYQLTIETGTRFGDLYDRGRLRGLPSDQLATEMYQATREICAAHGMLNYEVSNYAAPGRESQHNLIYWRYGDYLGIGPGAHSRLSLDGQRVGFATELHPDTYLKRVSETGHGRTETERLSADAQADEYLLMGLRLSEGISRKRLARFRGADLNADRLARLTEDGLIIATPDRITVTQQGRMILNHVIERLVIE